MKNRIITITLYISVIAGMLFISCSKSNDSSSPDPCANPGPLFLAVKQVVQANCVSCHAPGGQQPNPNFTIDCNIAEYATLIRTRAVVQGNMPPGGTLSQADKDKINNWVNAGGKLNQ